MQFAKFKLGVGTMSPSIVELCLEYSYLHNFPIMLIASRNQVDVNSGYAYTIGSLTAHVKNHKWYDPDRVLICRDHCGPFFSDLDKNHSLQYATDRCIETILADIKHGFDLIHIDISKVNAEHQERIAATLINITKTANPNIMIEFGSEDNTGEDLEDSLARLKAQLDFALRFKPNVKFFVSQTGSLTKHTQVGQFNEIIARGTADLIHSYNLLFKEHNADYLSQKQIARHKRHGIDAMNIAPQLGSIQTSIIHDLGKDLGLIYNNFRDYVLSKEYWKRWVTPEVIDDQTKFIASGHYCFNSIYGIELQDVLGNKIIEQMRPVVFAALDKYRIGLI